MVTGRGMSLLRAAILSLGMLDDAALALEEIEPEDKTRTEVLGARIALYMAAKKWHMATAVASRLVKVNLKTSLVDQSRLFGPTDRGSVEGGSHSAAGASDTPQGCHDCIQPRLLCERTGRMEEAKVRLRRAIKLEKDIRGLALDDEDLRPCGIGSLETPVRRKIGCSNPLLLIRSPTPPPPLPPA